MDRAAERQFRSELDFWAYCVAAGIPDELYERTTPPERLALLKAIEDREYSRRLHEAQCAALVAATLCNIHRKKGAKAYKVSDFVKDKRKRERPPDVTWELLKEQLRAHNARLAGETYVPKVRRERLR